ncbi:MAG: hypothetical protein Q8K79_17725 [Solirubrobacteraceae bacterium]|nr:hypothetical protein [Solirubrobacteraceae bacterium]
MLTFAAAVLVAGCGETRDSTATTGDSSAMRQDAKTTAAAQAPCTKPALLQELRSTSQGAPASIRTLRCAPGYALTRVSQGETRATLLWEDHSGLWSEIERVAPGVCSAQAAAHRLCAQPPPDSGLRRCDSRAFVAALREDVDQLRFAIDRMRCRGNFASTRYTFSDCLPEQTERRSACERTRVAAWRRDATRWRLITYGSTLDCAVVRAAAPRFPTALCD